MSIRFTCHTPRQGGITRGNASKRAAAGAGRRPVQTADPATAPPRKVPGKMKGKAAGKATGETHKAQPPRKEIGGPEGPEPTRFGDWERKGICYDF